MTNHSFKVYDPPAFTARHMQPAQELNAMLQPDFDKFFIVRVEDMYRLVQRPVNACRATTHSCLFLTSGEAIMKIGSRSYCLHPHEILFVPAGQVFSFQPGDVNTGFLCNFHNDTLTGPFGKTAVLQAFDFLKVWGNPLIQLPQETSDFILQLFQRLLLDYSRHGLQHPDIIQTYLNTLLCEVNRVYRPAGSHAPLTGLQIARRFQELVFTHIRDKHRVTDYAALLHISPNHLNKTVKAITGQSPTKWIDEAIILEAKVLLNQSGMSVQEVSAAVGLEDPSYFTRLFKKYEGCTPTQFRRMIEKSGYSLHIS
jgi:AraC-like DNA-binding protein